MYLIKIYQPHMSMKPKYTESHEIESDVLILPSLSPLSQTERLALEHYFWALEFGKG